MVFIPLVKRDKALFDNKASKWFNLHLLKNSLKRVWPRNKIYKFIIASSLS